MDDAKQVIRIIKTRYADHQVIRIIKTRYADHQCCTFRIIAEQNLTYFVCTSLYDISEVWAFLQYCPDKNYYGITLRPDIAPFLSEIEVMSEWKSYCVNDHDIYFENLVQILTKLKSDEALYAKFVEEVDFF